MILSPLLTKLSALRSRQFELTRLQKGQFVDPRQFDIRPGDRIIFAGDHYRHVFKIGREGRIAHGNLCVILDIGKNRVLRVNIQGDALTHFIEAHRTLEREGVPIVRMHSYFSTPERTHFVVVEKVNVWGTLVDVAQAFKADESDPQIHPLRCSKIRSLGEERVRRLFVDFVKTTSVFSMIDDLNAINLALCTRKNGPLHFRILDTGRLAPVDTAIARESDVRGHSTILNNPTFHRYLGGDLVSWIHTAHAAIVEARKSPGFAQRIANANGSLQAMAQAA